MGNAIKRLFGMPVYLGSDPATSRPENYDDHYGGRARGGASAKAIANAIVIAIVIVLVIVLVVMLVTSASSAPEKKSNFQGGCWSNSDCPSGEQCKFDYNYIMARGYCA